MAVDLQDRTSTAPDPVSSAVRLRPARRTGLRERFADTDPEPGLELTRDPRVARLVRNRKFQFLLIVPNQVVFWTVIFVGIAGTAIPGLNFGAAITWYVWFCLVFVMMVVVGRAWCAMCPFGGFAEWIQRRSFWNRTQKALGLGRKFPEPLARLGFLIPVASFLVLTWIEEFFNIAGPGNPADTSWMVVGIVSSALIFFLVFERRTFCRYVCPLTTLIGTVGSMGSAAGFRTKDREVCLSCRTKDCMRGGEKGYGCPWYTWPGSADSNLSCGLCSECYKACPEGNVGLFVQRPLTSVVAPRRRRADVAWGVAILWGLVVYQQFNATTAFASIDGWLNRNLLFPHYPDPVDYVGVIAAVALATAGAVWLLSRALGRADIATAHTESFVDRTSRFRAFFVPMAYGLIPVVGADYFARQLPKFFKHAARVVPAVAHIAGYSSARSPIYGFHILTDGWIVVVQVAVILAGTAAAAWATWKIAGRELVPVSRNALGVRIATLGMVLACGATASVLYVLMHAAS
ncbi:MAG: 4Fe-4S binding protein [Actinomycetota bacterium]|nr:4Fe-4S binding protein [Actinomycetota bacterium]